MVGEGGLGEGGETAPRPEGGRDDEWPSDAVAQVCLLSMCVG
jgi:hypothetical protein